MYFPKGIFPNSNFRVFYQEESSKKCLCRIARPPPSIAASVASEPNLWEVAALEIAHLGCYHLESCPWENAFGKIPNTKGTINVRKERLDKYYTVVF